MELSAAQAFLDAIKAALLLDTCHTLEPESSSLRLVFGIVDELINVRFALLLLNLRDPITNNGLDRPQTS